MKIVSPALQAELCCLFSPIQTEQPCMTIGVANAITTILYGSKKIRLGSSPCGDTISQTTKQIQRSIDRGLPVEMIALWGAAKGYGIDPERNMVDIADVLGYRRLANLSIAISRIYEPGLKIRIIREDIGEGLLNTHCPDLKSAMTSYCSGLDTLVRAFGVSGVEFVDESYILASSGSTHGQFVTKAECNARAIGAYWAASSCVPDYCKSLVPEYQNVLDLGWNGVITDETRQYYLRRSRTEYPNENEQELGFRISTYLGTALARYQFGFYKGTSRDEAGTIQPLKASFVPYPPGTPTSQRTGRFEYKVKDSKTSNSSTPPWCGFGVMANRSNGFEPTIIGIRDSCATEPVEALIDGIGGSCTFRADIVLQAA